MAKKVAKKPVAKKSATKKVSKKVAAKVSAKPAAKKAPAKVVAVKSAAVKAQPMKAAAGSSGGLQAGERLPGFELVAADGSTFHSASLAGKLAVVYVYPEASTPSCTKEACEFTDLIKEFEAAGAKVVAISPDGAAKLAKFRDKYSLAVTLAGDEPKGGTPEVIRKLGCWGEKSMYGKTYMGVIRSTFVVDRQGVIAQMWRNVKVPGHAMEVLGAVKALN